jgi:hypothetical protein
LGNALPYSGLAFEFEDHQPFRPELASRIRSRKLESHPTREYTSIDVRVHGRQGVVVRRVCAEPK